MGLEVTQIVPDMGTAPGGVRDYALLLAGELLRSHGIQSSFIATSDSGHADCRDLSGWKMQNIALRVPGELTLSVERLSAGQTSPNLILHYSNYGYQSRGVPFRLLRGLKELKVSLPSSKLVTIFHEIYAMGWPWQSSFWLSPIQRAMAKQVCGLSDGVITSLPRYGRILEGWRFPSEKLKVCAVLSTVGEIENPVPLAERRRQLVVFGSSGLRRRLYLEASVDLLNWMERLDIVEIVDIGAASGVAAEIVKGMRVRETGVIPASEVSGILAESYAGAIAYPPGFLGKSTVFAAYCAHGVLPLVFSKKSEGREEVESGKHYILSGDPVVGAKESYFYGEIARLSYSWYQGHSLARLASHVAAVIRNSLG